MRDIVFCCYCYCFRYKRKTNYEMESHIGKCTKSSSIILQSNLFESYTHTHSRSFHCNQFSITNSVGVPLFPHILLRYTRFFLSTFARNSHFWFHNNFLKKTKKRRKIKIISVTYLCVHSAENMSIFFMFLNQFN